MREGGVALLKSACPRFRAAAAEALRYGVVRCTKARRLAGLLCSSGRPDTGSLWRKAAVRLGGVSSFRSCRSRATTPLLNVSGGARSARPVIWRPMNRMTARRRAMMLYIVRRPGRVTLSVPSIGQCFRVERENKHLVSVLVPWSGHRVEVHV